MAAARAAAISGQRAALVTLLPGDFETGRALIDTTGSVVAADPGIAVPEGVRRAAVERIVRDRPGVELADHREWFVDVITPPPTLRIFGAGPIAESLCRLGAAAGFAVVVGDPRPAHATAERFPEAVAVDCGWPDDLLRRRPLGDDCFVVSLLHAERFEDVLLPLVLNHPVRYVGALGSRQTHAARVERLIASGFAPDQVARIHGPVGLAIGAVTPEEIAVAILAEMVQVRRGGSHPSHES
ncbi:MAG TPA: XdhC family protein [Acidimicrobiia bacterium]|nr:XdhC family protein [Acidimicrobiia bacterium]